MCKSLHSEINKKGRTFSAFSSFLFKRVRRLMPALLFWCIFCLFMANLLAPDMGISPAKSLDTLIYSLTAISNIFYFIKTVSGVPYDPLLSVTWSLSLEWQLYLILAVLAISLNQRVLSLLLIAIILIFSFILPSGVNHQETIGWWIRPQAFMLGALIFLHQDKLKRLMSNNALNLLVFILSVIGLVCYTTVINPVYKLPFIGVCGAIAFATLGVCCKPFSSSLLNWIGDRSYSIYLCHIPSMIITRLMLDKLLESTAYFHSTVIYVSCFAVITALLANFSYEYIERRFIYAPQRKAA